MRVLIMNGRGLVSSMIRTAVNGNVTHAAVLTDQNTIIEAWQGSGLREKPMFTDLEGITPYSIAPEYEHLWPEIYQWMRDEIKKGKGYNYKGIVSFLIRISGANTNGYFCSEFIAEAFKNKNYPLLKRIESWKIDPYSLQTSPLLIESDFPVFN